MNKLFTRFMAVLIACLCFGVNAQAASGVSGYPEGYKPKSGYDWSRADIGNDFSTTSGYAENRGTYYQIYGGEYANLTSKNSITLTSDKTYILAAKVNISSQGECNLKLGNINFKTTSASGEWKFSDEIVITEDVKDNFVISVNVTSGIVYLYGVAILEKDKPSSGGETPGQGGGEDPGQGGGEDPTPGEALDITWDFTNGTWPSDNNDTSISQYWTVGEGQFDAVYEEMWGMMLTWAQVKLTGVNLVAGKTYKIIVDGVNMAPNNYDINGSNEKYFTNAYYNEAEKSYLFKSELDGICNIYVKPIADVTYASIKTIRVYETDEEIPVPAPVAPADLSATSQGKTITVSFTMPENVESGVINLVYPAFAMTLGTKEFTGEAGLYTTTFNVENTGDFTVNVTFTNKTGSVDASTNVTVYVKPDAPSTYSVVADGNNVNIITDLSAMATTWSSVTLKRNGNTIDIISREDLWNNRSKMAYEYTDYAPGFGTFAYTLEIVNETSEPTVVNLGSVTIEKVVEVPVTWSFTERENLIIVWPSDLEKNDKWTIPVTRFDQIQPTANGAYFITPKVNLVGGKKYTVSMSGVSILPSLSYGLDKNCNVELIDKWGEDEDENKYEIPGGDGGTSSITFLCEETGSYYFKFVASEIYTDASISSFKIENYIANPGYATDVVAEANGLDISLSCKLPTKDIDGGDITYSFQKVELLLDGVVVETKYPRPGDVYTYTTSKPAGTYNYALKVYRTYDDFTITNFPAVTTEVPVKTVPYTVSFYSNANTLTNEGVAVFDGSGNNVGFDNGSFTTTDWGVMANSISGYLVMPAINLAAGTRYNGVFDVRYQIFTVGYSRTGSPADFVEIGSNGRFEFTPEESGKYFFILRANGSDWSYVYSFNLQEVVNVAPQTPSANTEVGESINVKVKAAERDNKGFTYADDAEFTLTFNATVNAGGEETTVNETATVAPGEEYEFTVVANYDNALYYNISYSVVASYNGLDSYEQTGTYREGFAPKFENLAVSQNANGNLDLTFTVADKSVRGADLTGSVSCNVSVTPNGYGNAYGEYGSTLTATDVVRTPQHGVEYVFTVYTGNGDNRGEASISYTYNGNEVWGQGDNKFNVYYDGTVHTEANAIVYTEGEGYSANLIVLTDGEAYTGVKADVNAKEITFSRTFAEGHTDWQAWYAPFDVDASEFAYAAILSRHYQDDADGEYYLEFEHVTGKLEANVPYIVKPLHGGVNEYTANNAVLKATPATDGSVSAGGEYSFNGIYQSKDVWYYENIYALHNGEFKGVEIDYNTWTYHKTLKPFRAFLKAESNGPSYLRVKVNGETDFIEGINADNAEGLYYDLQGRMVKNPTTGVYIKDGKKVYVK